jgi:hypothetical protein
MSQCHTLQQKKECKTEERNATRCNTPQHHPHGRCSHRVSKGVHNTCFYLKVYAA